MAACSTCSANVIPGSLFCDCCGAPQNNVKVARKLRQSSFSQIKDAGKGLLSAGEKIKARGQAYIIEEAIARSGFGATFRATRVSDKKQVLIKQMIEQSAYDQFKAQLMESFKREAKFLRRIKHPAFPRGFQYFQRHGSFYLVMEFINGKELAKALDEYREQNGDLPDGLLVFIGIQVAEALQIVHDAGYIYRDLKPQNVMLDGISSRVKLIDFGTLYHRSDKDPLIFESAGYTPPDLMDNTKPFKPAGDIYSLGALLYEAATGATPSHGDASGLSDRDRDPRLNAIIRKCLELDPDKRYQRARDVKHELSKLTKKGFWLWRKKAIDPVELSVLPKTLYPAACTFCDYCGHADPDSQAGYCKDCRIPLKVGRVTWKKAKRDKQESEFFLYADETIIGSSKESHLCLGDIEGGDSLGGRHLRIGRRKNALWVEAVDGNEQATRLNRRRVLGPVELLEGDTLQIGNVLITFSLRDAC